jgi:hypothetical protein
MEDDDGKSDDFAILGPPADGGGNHVLRHRPDCSWEAGIVKPLEDGKPINGELVYLRPREDGGPGYAVESIDAGLPVRPSGPSMVNSRAFRDGWDGIFGHRAPAGEA